MFDVYKYRPFITLKISASLDGKFATKDSSGQEILRDEAQARVQLELSQRQAILTGAGTILKDDPSLIPQSEGVVYQGLRILLDTHLSVPMDAQIISTKWMGDVWIFTSTDADKDKKVKLEALGIKIIEIEKTSGNRISLPFVLEYLADANVRKVIVNAGPALSSSFLKMKVWDELLLFRAPYLIGADGKDAFGPLDVSTPDKSIALNLVNLEQVGNEILETYKPA